MSDTIICMMLDDPRYRGLMERHGFAGGEQSIELVTESRREETSGHIRKATQHVNYMMEKKPSKLEDKLDKTMRELLIANVQVAEVYSPPRVTRMAEQLGLNA